MGGNDGLAKAIGEDPNAASIIGDRDSIAIELRWWLSQFEDIQLVSDVCHYDMVLFVDLFGTAFDLPEQVCASCHDINQDIATHCGISEKEAFDYSREELISDFNIFIDRDKHNALYDAKVIKEIYGVIHK